MTKQNFDIYNRIFEFVIKVILFLDKLPKTPTNLVCIGQCTRSVTSMGANGEEADGSFTKKEFLHCFTIVRKEGKETVFWLKVINHTNKSFSQEATELIQEGNELVAIVSSIIKNTSKNSK